MEIASFEPVVGEIYEIQNMMILMRGKFLGFIQRVWEGEVHGKKVYPREGEPLLLFEIKRREGEPRGYRYAGAHIQTYYDVYKKRIRFSLYAEHFGNSIADIERHGPQKPRFWRLVGENGQTIDHRGLPGLI